MNNSRSEINGTSGTFPSGRQLADWPTIGRRNGHAAVSLSLPTGIPTPPYWYWLLFKTFWKDILATTVAVVFATALLQVLAFPHWWQASAVLLPLTNETQAGAIASMVSSVGSNIGAELQGLLGVQNQAEQDADEYMAIMNGFDFTTELIVHHQLQGNFRPTLLWRLLHPGRSLTPFKIYKLMQKRFECQWDDKNQVLNLSYSDRNKAGAEMLLGLIISDLRERLRAQEILQARSAVDSLTNQVKRTTDYQLQAQLYSLMAGQIQAMDLAEMQADFSFLVVDKPHAPDMFSWPPVWLSSIGLFVFTPAVFLAFLLLRRRADMAARDYLELVGHNGSVPGHEPASNSDPLVDKAHLQKPFLSTRTEDTDSSEL